MSRAPRITLMTALALAAGMLCASAQEGLQAGNLAVRWDEDSASVLATSAFDEGLITGLNLRVHDGRRDETLALTAEEVSLRAGMLTLRYSCDRPLTIMAM